MSRSGAGSSNELVALVAHASSEVEVNDEAEAASGNQASEEIEIDEPDSEPEGAVAGNASSGLPQTSESKANILSNLSEALHTQMAEASTESRTFEKTLKPGKKLHWKILKYMLLPFLFMGMPLIVFDQFMGDKLGTRPMVLIWYFLDTPKQRAVVLEQFKFGNWLRVVCVVSYSTLVIFEVLMMLFLQDALGFWVTRAFVFFPFAVLGIIAFVQVQQRQEYTQSTYPCSSIRLTPHNIMGILVIGFDLFAMISLFVRPEFFPSGAGFFANLFDIRIYKHLGVTIPELRFWGVVAASCLEMTLMLWLYFTFDLFAKKQEVLQNKVLPLVLNVLTNVLFLTIMLNILSGLDNPDKPEHPAYGQSDWTKRVVGLISGVMLTAYICTALFYSSSVLARTDGHLLSPKLDIRYSQSFVITEKMAKLFLGGFNTFFESGSVWSMSTSCIVSGVLCSYLFIVNLSSWPCCVEWINVLRCVAYFILAWSALCSFIAITFFSDATGKVLPNHWFSFVLLLVGWAAAVVAGLLWYVMKRNVWNVEADALYMWGFLPKPQSTALAHNPIPVEAEDAEGADATESCDEGGSPMDAAGQQQGADATKWWRVPKPERLPDPHAFAIVACGGHVGDDSDPASKKPLEGTPFTAALSWESAFFSCGVNDFGQLGLGDEVYRYNLTQVTNPFWQHRHLVTYVACGGYHTAVITAQGFVFTFGKGSYGQLGYDKKTVEEEQSAATLHRPRPVPLYDTEQKIPLFARLVACGTYHTVVVCDKPPPYEKGKHGAKQARSKYERGEVDQVDECLKGSLVYAFGRGLEGQLGLTDMVPPPDGTISHPDGKSDEHDYLQFLPARVDLPEENTSVVHVSAGLYHTALAAKTAISDETTAEGKKLYRWKSCLLTFGSNEFGQLGREGLRHLARPANINSASLHAPVCAADEEVAILKVACGGYHTAVIVAPALAVTKGWLLTCGRAESGQLGLFVHEQDPNVEDELPTAETMKAAYLNRDKKGVREFRVVVDKDRKAVGQWESVACGFAHTVAITVKNDLRQLWSFGRNMEGQLGTVVEPHEWGLPVHVELGTSRQRVYFEKKMAKHDGPFSVACGSTHTMVSAWGSGDMYGFGTSNSWIGLGINHGESSILNIATKANGPANEPIVSCDSGCSHVALVNEAGKVLMWPPPDSRLTGVEVLNATSEAAEELPPATEEAEDKGRWKPWYRRRSRKRKNLPPTFAQLGLFPGSPKIVGVSCGSNFTAFRSAAGELFTMGRNRWGQLGRRGQDATQLARVVVDPEEKVTDVSCGFIHMAIVTDKGRLYTCGSDGFGADVRYNFALPRTSGLLGLNREPKQGLPKQTPPADEESGGNVWIPQRVTKFDFNGCEPPKGEVKIDMVSAGFAHTGAVGSDGALYVFGSSVFGRLGLGPNVPNQEFPKRVVFAPAANTPPGTCCVGPPNDDSKDFVVEKVSCGLLHTLALEKIGPHSNQYRHVYAWGMAGHGQLGLGNIKETNVCYPTTVPTLKPLKVNAMYAGTYQSAFVTRAGEVWVTGSHFMAGVGLGPVNNTQFTPRIMGTTMGRRNRGVCLGDHFGCAW